MRKVFRTRQMNLNANKEAAEWPLGHACALCARQFILPKPKFSLLHFDENQIFLRKYFKQIELSTLPNSLSRNLFFPFQNHKFYHVFSPKLHNFFAKIVFPGIGCTPLSLQPNAVSESAQDHLLTGNGRRLAANLEATNTEGIISPLLLVTLSVREVTCTEEGDFGSLSLFFFLRTIFLRGGRLGVGQGPK